MAVRYEGKFTRSLSLKRAADTTIVVEQPMEYEDEFQSLYAAQNSRALILEPPFNPLQLSALCTRNNVLQQCVHAMEVNVDGTGHTLELIEGLGEDEQQKKRAESFFKKPNPKMSFVTLRRKLRVDLEQVGWGFIEVLRNAAGRVVMLRHIKASTMRIVKLDEPVAVEVEMEVDGVVEKLTMMVRERRFVQKIGQKLVYYKEYGASREVNRDTGLWSTTKLPAKKQGSEVLYFVADEDVTTPYGVPKWINNMPSALGSRKSEEFNLDFFDAGGLPPAIVFIEGGTLGKQVREQLQHYLSGVASKRNRAAIVEASPSGGSFETQGKVGVKVERFGDSRQSDAMFQNYSQQCEERIRAAFRLPPIFLGKAQDYSFASALTSYMVAEAQVFAPERLEFDEIINNTLMQALEVKNYRFTSKPITLSNVEVQLQGLELVKNKVDGENFVETVNEITGLTLQYSKEIEDKAFEAEQKKNMFGKPGEGKPGAQGNDPASQFRDNPGLPSASSLSSKRGIDLIKLADEWANTNFADKCTPERKREVVSKIDGLSGADRTHFMRLVTLMSFSSAKKAAMPVALTKACLNHMHARV